MEKDVGEATADFEEASLQPDHLKHINTVLESLDHQMSEESAPSVSDLHDGQVVSSPIMAEALLEPKANSASLRPGFFGAGGHL